MSRPQKPVAPPQALRSDPSTFAQRTEDQIAYQAAEFPDWLDLMADYVEAQAAASAVGFNPNSLQPISASPAQEILSRSGNQIKITQLSELLLQIDPVELALAMKTPIRNFTSFMDGFAVSDGGRLVDGANTYARTASTFPFLVDGDDLVFFDARGLFERFADPTGAIDPDGDTRAIGAMQGDAIRNITGAYICHANLRAADIIEGAFYQSGSALEHVGGDFAFGSPETFGFDASLVVPTADENRPKNFNGTYMHWPLG